LKRNVHVVHITDTYYHNKASNTRMMYTKPTFILSARRRTVSCFVNLRASFSDSIYNTSYKVDNAKVTNLLNQLMNITNLLSYF